mmetsp:Transcript_12913/g.24362  ORF Transcript_12913/g.24362 Transcript_12913/m.24362 type:complete len:292 (+) Transcript_12913:75-950(+)
MDGVMLEKTVVVLSYVISLAVNGFAASGALSGQSIGDISDEYPTYVTPDGRTFAVWAVIYTLELVLVVMQCCASTAMEEILQKPCQLTGLSVRQRLVAAFVLNAIWLPIYVNLLFAVALVIIIAYFVFLLSVYIDLNTMTVSSFAEWAGYAAGIACNASWVLVATSANKFTVLGQLGWKDEFGVAGTPGMAVVVVAVVSAVAIAFAVLRSDFAWSLVACWALSGLYRTHTIPDPDSFPPAAMNKTIAECSLWGAIVVGVASLLGLALIPYNGAFRSDKGGFKAVRTGLTSE